MFMNQNETCRLCLSSDMYKSYYSLKDHEDIEHLKASLSLESDLSDISAHPSHICDDCNNVTKSFVKLKKLALEHEAFLIRYKQQIQKIGITAALEIARLDIPEGNSDYHPDNLLGMIKGDDIKEDIKSELEEWEPNDQDYLTDQDDNLTGLQRKKVGIFEEIEKNEKNVIWQKCSLCDKSCRTKKLMRSHMLTHNRELVKCPRCVPDRFVKVLRKHLKNFHTVKDIPCDYEGCGKVFKTKGVLKWHIKTIHMQERSLCSNCGDSVRDIFYHLQTCDKDNIKKLTCNICEKKLACKLTLNMHMENIHGPPTPLVVCHICAKEVKDIKNHMKVNHSKRPEKKICCQSAGCEMMFRTKQEESNHYNRVHLDLKYQCPICLEWMKNVASHVQQVHQQDKKHVCSQCGKSFFKSSDLKVHIERVHQGKRYICPECGKTVSKIRDHMKALHGLSEIDKSAITTIITNVI
eukprot:GFUD01043178.1.p1 GENE.GFUD01043178.1~~GFUD01043178.1.p1  ORF type:complete len:464 (+),score=96.46 GFUD01043178.1:115-1506(+)